MDRSEARNDEVVSFEDEPLILVDEHDNVVGHESKAACHEGDGLLHRAFSIFLFDDRGRLLLQRRSAQKRLWPGYWSNSCCSHPRRGEDDHEAAERRIYEELGVQPPLRYLFRFRYQARFGEIGAEHELCSIYVARTEATVSVNVNEVAETRHISPEQLDLELREQPAAYTPWLKLEWPRIREEHWDAVAELLSQ